MICEDFIVDLGNREAVLCNLDLIFMATLHQIETSISVKATSSNAIGTFEYVKEDQYNLTEYEVRQPALSCPACWQKIERLADNYITMIRIISSLHEPTKVAQHL